MGGKESATSLPFARRPVPVDRSGRPSRDTIGGQKGAFHRWRRKPLPHAALPCSSMGAVILGIPLAIATVVEVAAVAAQLPQVVGQLPHAAPVVAPLHPEDIGETLRRPPGAVSRRRRGPGRRTAFGQGKAWLTLFLGAALPRSTDFASTTPSSLHLAGESIYRLIASTPGRF